MDRLRRAPGAVRAEAVDPEDTGPETDAQLVGRFRNGDQAAFDGLVLRHRKEIYRLAWRITGDHAEADDLAQETFCRAYEALHEFRGDASFRTWLYRIVTNLSLNVLQSARVSRRDPAPIEELAEAGAILTTDPVEADHLRQERDRQLRDAIRTLPPRQKSTLILRAFEGLPYKEIARVMGCTVGTAKANFFHAVAFLRREIKETR